MTTLKDNPAARLLTIFESGKQKQRDQNCRATWCALLLVTMNNEPLLQAKLARVSGLAEEIRRLVDENIPEHAPEAQYVFDKVSHSFFHQNLNSQWSTFIDTIDQQTIGYLRLLASLLQVGIESPRVLRRLQLLREWSHEQVKQVFT